MKSLTDKLGDQGGFRHLFVEFFGTFVLTFVSCWALIAKDLQSSMQLGPALAAGLVVFIFLWMGSSQRMSSLNPALTLALLIMRKQEWSEGLTYIILQFAGAIVASGFVFIELAGEQAELIAHGSVLGIPSVGSQTYESSVLMGEVLAGVFLGYAYFGAYVGRKEPPCPCKGAAAVGFAVFLLLLTLTEAFGVGLNPARSLSPALMSGRMGSAQLGHFVGPVVGCLLGGVIQVSIFSDEDEEEADPRAAPGEGEQILKNGHKHYDREVELEERPGE